MEASANAMKRPKHRSPSYPALDLEKALARAKELSDVAGRHPAPVTSALSAWGYSQKSSNGLLTIAALKKFGLAVDQGKSAARQLRLTQLGHELVFYDGDRDSQEWKDRAHTAVFTPTIHRELWQKYNGDLPADGVIRPYLVLDRGFSQSAADEVLREFRSTLSFAQIGPGESRDILSGLLADEKGELLGMSELTAEQNPPPPPGTGESRTGSKPRTVQVPYSPGQWALIQAQFPLSEAEWTQMLAVLDAMKPGLVSND